MGREKSVAFHLTKVTTEPDEVAIDRACNGERIRLYSNELGIAVHRLLAEGLSHNQIARRLGCTTQAVARHRKLDPCVLHPEWVKIRELREAMTELINQGVRTMEIVRKLGCDRKTVYRHRRRLAEESVAA